MRDALESATNDTTYCHGSESSAIVGIGESVSRVEPHPASLNHHPEGIVGGVRRNPRVDPHLPARLVAVQRDWKFYHIKAKRDGRRA